MPGLIGSQGVRPGALNMSRVFRALRYRTQQAQFVTYYRPPIYATDKYGIPTGSAPSTTGEEIVLPDLPAIIRPKVTADYSQERAGNNIIGAARVYTPNITTIKNYTNFDQADNTDFNEIEGWDRLITNYRTIYNVWTSGATMVSGNYQYAWTAESGSVTSDGETVTNTLTGDGTMTYTTTGTKNILEADRIRFKIKPNFEMTLTSFVSTNTSDKELVYTPDTLVIPSGNWLTIDVPFVSGTTETSIYQSGTRYETPITIASTYDYETDLKTLVLNYTGQTEVTDTIQIKAAEFYKSVSWHVHSLKDMTDGYIIFNCVRTRGRIDSRRRAYS